MTSTFLRGLVIGVVAVGSMAPGAAGQIIVGRDEGAAAPVQIFSTTGSDLGGFFAYGTGFTGGVRVASGDVNGDSVPDVITGAGTTGAGHVKVFDGVSGAEIRSFLAYPGFNGGVFVAAGDVDNDSRDDLVTGADGANGGHVKVFSGATGAELRSFFAYPTGFVGGVRVASGDVTGDGFADVITGAGAGGSGHVKVFDGVSGAEVRSFLAYGGFTGGVFVAAGDVSGDGRADIVTGVDAATGVAPHVKVFDGVTGAELHSFFAYDASFAGGVRVAAGDLTGDGRADVITGPGANGNGQVKIFNGATGELVDDFLVFGTRVSGGIFVAASAPIPEPTTAALVAFTLIAAAGRRGSARVV